MTLGCAKKDVTPPPPAPIRAEPTVTLPPRPEGPAWESQTQDTLPTPQPIPPEVASLDAPPLRIDRQEPPAAGAAAGPAEPSAPVETDREPPSAPPEDAPAPFRLGQILSAAQRREYNDMIDRDLEAAEQSLSLALSRGNLQERGVQVRRIRAFMTQAGDVRVDDLPLARNLAARARLLAEDLARVKP